MKLKTSLTIAATFLISSAIAYPMAAEAATNTFSDQTTFLSQLSTAITDTYSSPPYGTLVTNIYTDAQMNAIFGQTTYHPTEFLDVNIVSFGHYCAGCNGSF